MGTKVGVNKKLLWGAPPLFFFPKTKKNKMGAPPPPPAPPKNFPPPFFSPFAEKIFYFKRGQNRFFIRVPYTSIGFDKENSLNNNYRKFSSLPSFISLKTSAISIAKPKEFQSLSPLLHGDQGNDSCPGITFCHPSAINFTFLIFYPIICIPVTHFYQLLVSEPIIKKKSKYNSGFLSLAKLFIERTKITLLRLSVH